MSKFTYHPEVIDSRFFNRHWFVQRVSELLEEYNPRCSRFAEFGWDQQYDRTIDEDGNPGEYIQVWMRIEEEEC